MKKIILTVAMALTMTVAFAEGENEKNTQNVQAYNMRVNISMLAKALQLNSDQIETVEYVQDMFSREMMSVAEAAEEERSEKMKKAINRDLANMRYILNEDQYRTYVRILNVTLYNRGLRK